jgi:hypothetical protein
VSTRSERACVSRMYAAVRENLERWKDTLSAPPSTHVLARQFRHDAEGRLLRATEAGTQAHHSVGALVCQLETPSGLIRVTAEAATLPAAAASTDLQPTIALRCSDSESDDDEVTEESTRERDLGVGAGRDSRYGSIYVCPPLPPETPRAPRCSPLSSSSLPLSPPDPTPSIRPTGRLAWGTQGPRQVHRARRSPDWAACSRRYVRSCWRRAVGGPASTLRVTVTPGWAFSP